MKALLLAIVLAAILAPVSQSFSQLVDSDSTLSVITTSNSPYVYKNSAGHTVVVGEIENRNALSAMSGIIIRAVFYDESGGQIIEIVRGTTVIDIVPPGGTSPYVITSVSPNPDIGLASVGIETFNSAPTKPVGLELSSESISNREAVEFAGSVRNAGHAPSDDTVVYLAFHDVFDPPRLLHVEEIYVGYIPIGQEAEFQFSGTPNSRAVGFKMLAESDVFRSESVGVDIPPQALHASLATISNLWIADREGNRISTIPSGATVNIGSDLTLQTISDDRVQPFVYYVQVKASGPAPYVEFLGFVRGSFEAASHTTASVEWTPTEPGLYFVETFVWDQNHNPISSKGPVSIVMVR